MSSAHGLNADLHCHSTTSDGTLTPTELAARAKANGVELWALTDHDETRGLAEAMSAAATHGLAFTTGVEISVTFAQETLHIVGLAIDPAHPQLHLGLKTLRAGRDQRAEQMGEQLAKVGIKGAYEGALKYVGNPALVSRTHFARYLVEQGICANTGDVFRRYLTTGKPGYVKHEWARLSEAVGWIRASGGVAVIAHPGRYKLTPTEEMALFDEFKALGGEAIEVITGSHTTSDFAKYAQTANELQFAASRGSDFHSPQESHTDLGDWQRLPALPMHIEPVWARWM
jgi:predicted metal-dependent phosphoesterase TrpH